MDKDVYKYSLDIAIKNEETKVFHESNLLNQYCRDAIDKSIRDSNYDTYRYDLKSAVNTVISAFGKERVDWVMANTIQQKHYDGRFSSANREWAKKFDISLENSRGYISNTHPAVLDGFLNRLHEKEKEINKPLMNSVSKKIKKTETLPTKTKEKTEKKKTDHER